MKRSCSKASFCPTFTTKSFFKEVLRHTNFIIVITVCIHGKRLPFRVAVKHEVRFCWGKKPLKSSIFPSRLTKKKVKPYRNQVHMLTCGYVIAYHLSSGMQWMRWTLSVMDKWKCLNIKCLMLTWIQLASLLNAWMMSPLLKFNPLKLRGMRSSDEPS